MKTVITILLLIVSSPTLADPIRDPMRPPMVSAAATASPTAAPAVSAVFISRARRVAVVYGRVVRAGDRVGDCIVDEVVPDGIRCRHGANLRVTPTAAAAVAFRTPAVQSTVAANGDEK